MDGLQAALDRLIRRRFGRKQGVIRVARAKLELLAGRYAQRQDVALERVDRLVFVCLGNLCRSPYGEAVARSLGVSATSFGLEARDGSEADAAAVQAARTRQIDLSGHRARRRVELGAGDLVLAVEPAHLERVDRLARLAGAQASLLGLWARPAQPHIEDPFALSPEYFQTCYGVIDDAVRRLAEGLRRSPG